MSCCGSSSVKPTTNNQQAVEKQGCCKSSTSIKVSLFVVGSLLIAAAAGIYFAHINTIATCATATAGLAVVVGTAIWSFVDCCRKKDPSANIPDAERKEYTINLPKGKQISQEDITNLIGRFPKLATLIVNTAKGETPTERATDLQPHFVYEKDESGEQHFVFHRFFPKQK